MPESDSPNMSTFSSRMWSNITIALGTTTLSIFLWIAIPVVACIGTAIYEGYTKWKPGLSMLLLTRDALFSVPTMISAGVTIFAWICLFSGMFIRTIRQDEQTLSGALSDKAELLKNLEQAQGEKVAVEVLCERISKELEASEARIREKEEEIKKLKLPELPALRPCIVAATYGKPQGYTWAGLLIANDGEPAYDISIPPVQIGTSVLEIEPEVHRLTKDDGRKYCKVWIRQEHRGTATGDGLMKEMVDQGLVDLDVTIRYKDGGNRWYKTTCKLERDVRTSGGITAKFIGQELVVRPTEDTIGTMPNNAPELLIEYDHSEQVTWSQEPSSPDSPLIVKNVSEGKNAFNVAIRPLVTEDGTAEFQPAVVTCIKGGDQAEFNAHVDGAPRFSKNQLVDLLSKSYKEGVPGYDISRDLFGNRSFTITVEYQDSSGQKYAADCEISYRKWKNETHPGKHRIRRIL